MTVEELRQEIKRYHISYAQLAEASGIPLGTIKNAFSKKIERNPRIDTITALEKGIEKIKISTGVYPIDIKEFEQITKNNELAKKISELPEEVQDALFDFIEKTIDSYKK